MKKYRSSLSHFIFLVMAMWPYGSRTQGVTLRDSAFCWRYK